LLIAPRLLAHPSIHIHIEYSRVTHHQGTTHDDDNNNPLSHFNTPAPPGSSPPPLLSLSFFPTLCGNNDQDGQPYFLCNSLAFNLGLDVVFSDPPSVESLCSECGSQGGFTFYFWVGNEQLGVTHLAHGELSGMKVLLLLTSQESQDSEERQNNLKAKVLGSTHK